MNALVHEPADMHDLLRTGMASFLDLIIIHAKLDASQDQIEQFIGYLQFRFICLAFSEVA